MTVSGGDRPQPPPPPRWRSQPWLRAELLARAERDQRARHAGGAAEMRLVDGENVAWLAPVIAEHGWLDAELVGDDGAHACWLLCQHAPPERRNEWLPLLRDAVARGVAERRDLAYLQDRVDSDHGRPQTYGTQYRGFGDEPARLWPVIDPAGVNALREGLGLPPLDEHTLAGAWTLEEISARLTVRVPGPERR